MKEKALKKNPPSSASKRTSARRRETDTEMLARIMVNGFEEIKRTMATKEELAEVKQDLVLVKQGQEEMKEELALVKQGQEEMKEEISSLKEEQKETNRTVKSYEKKQAGMLLSLDETVHRSEFDGLVRRVRVLEK